MIPKSQRDMMRELNTRFPKDSERIIRDYATAERRGMVRRHRNEHGISPEDYARRLWADGLKKGWLNG